MTRRLGECARHRDALESFVGDEPIGADAALALDHLDRCDACRIEAEQLALAVFALRRLSREAESATAALAEVVDGPRSTDDDRAAGAAASADDDAWPSLRARVTRSRTPAWRWRSQVAGVLLGAGLVAAVIGPTSVQNLSTADLDEAGAIPGQTIDATRQDVLGEEAWMRAVDRARKERPIEPVVVTTPVVRVDRGIFGAEAVPPPTVWQPPRLQNAR